MPAFILGPAGLQRILKNHEYYAKVISVAVARAKRLLRHLAADDRVGFTAAEARQWLYPERTDPGAANATYELLHGLVREGLLHRLAPGLYASALAGNALDEWDIAMLLDAQGILSHQSALMLHHLTQQLYRSVTLTVPGSSHDHRPGRVIQACPYTFVVVSPRRFFGHEVRYVHARPLRLTDVERTLLDCLAAPAHVGGIAIVYDALEVALPRLYVPRLVEYLARLRAPSLAQRLGYLLERHGVESHRLVDIHSLTGTRIVPLDIHSQADGLVDSTWKVRSNVPLPD